LKPGSQSVLSIEQIVTLLEAAPGVQLVDSRSEHQHPTQLSHAAGTDDVFVGRLRRDHTHELGVNMWVVSDNIRKGAALNAIQIMEKLAGITAD
jgi:aspartate-semialdehyde dehydrogenase